MASMIPGYTTEQKVLTVPNDDTSMNDAIATESAFQWVVSTLILSGGGANMVILFTRTIAETPAA